MFSTSLTFAKHEHVDVKKKCTRKRDTSPKGEQTKPSLRFSIFIPTLSSSPLISRWVSGIHALEVWWSAAKRLKSCYRFYSLLESLWNFENSSPVSLIIYQLPSLLSLTTLGDFLRHSTLSCLLWAEWKSALLSTRFFTFIAARKWWWELTRGERWIEIDLKLKSCVPR